jgi:AraC family transcriptional regulator
VKTPDRTTARGFNRYLSGDVLADSAALGWTGLYVRLCRLPRVVDSFLVPATPEPLITSNAKGSVEFRERDVGGAWITRKIEPDAMFVTHSKTPYEVRWTSPAGQEIEVIQIHLAVDVFRAALAVAPGQI